MGPCSRVKLAGNEVEFPGIGTLKAMDHRIKGILESIEELIMSLPLCTARKLSSFVGKVISLMPIIGNLVQLRTRFSSIAQQTHWDKTFRIPADCPVLDEIFFWRNNVIDLNIKQVFSYQLPQVLVYSDASSTGCGAIRYDSLHSDTGTNSISSIAHG